MTTDAMRSALSEVYSGAKWRKRVELMPDAQVVAVYKRFKRSGELVKKHISGNERKPDLEHLSVDSEGRLVYCANAW